MVASGQIITWLWLGSLGKSRARSCKCQASTWTTCRPGMYVATFPDACGLMPSILQPHMSSSAPAGRPIGTVGVLSTHRWATHLWKPMSISMGSV